MNEFLRKNKNKLGASAAAFLLGLTAINLATDDSHEKHPTAVASTTVTVSETVGGADSGWEQGAAERAIRKGLVLAAARLSVNGIDFTEQVGELSTYDSAMKAVEMAHEAGGIPDKGDKYRVTIEETEDSAGNIEYEVTDAEIIDIPNNQD